MIDVHPPHQATHTWTDFFIHIATIVVGLLFAIGLEQTVEYVHHRHQLAEVRAALDQERDQNLHSIERNRGLYAKVNADLFEDARLLQHRAAGDRTPLAGKLNYNWNGYMLHDAAWQTTKESAVLGLMPDRDRERYAYRYLIIGLQMDRGRDYTRAEDRAAAIVRDNPDGNFSVDDTRELLEATHEAQGALAYMEKDEKFVADSSK
jgi:hypothetical protein